MFNTQVINRNIVDDGLIRKKGLGSFINDAAAEKFLLRTSSSQEMPFSRLVHLARTFQELLRKSRKTNTDSLNKKLPCVLIKNV
jgi:hypothetical protein